MEIYIVLRRVISGVVVIFRVKLGVIIIYLCFFFHMVSESTLALCFVFFLSNEEETSAVGLAPG